MKIDVLTIFPEMFEALNASIIARARETGLIDLQVTDIRPFSAAKHKNTDDYPYGGGAGMLMTPQPIADAIKAVAPDPYQGLRIFMSPRGRPLTQARVKQWAEADGITVLCGRFEGVDQRVLDARGFEEVSVGDAVLAGGEAAAMVAIEACVRLVPGVLGAAESLSTESFEDDLLEHPQYTRPRTFEGHDIPEVLLSGDHKKIAKWRQEQREKTTRERRPDLWERHLANLQVKSKQAPEK